MPTKATQKVEAEEAKTDLPTTWQEVTLAGYTTHVFRVQRPDGPTKDQNEGLGRKFIASGPKAEAIAKMLVFGQQTGEPFTRDEIVAATGCSASRVSEVVWVLEANYPGFDKTKAMKRKAKPVLVPATVENTATPAA